MSAALPVLVDCAPYRTKLSMEACVRRHVIAEGGTWKKGDPAGTAAATSSFLRFGSACKGCQVGAARALELKAAGVDISIPKNAERMKVRKKGAALRRLLEVAKENDATRGRLAHPQAGPSPAATRATKTTNEGKAMAEKKDCAFCQKPFQQVKSDQLFCSKEHRLAYYRSNPPPSKGGESSTPIAKRAPRADVSTPARPRSPFETFVALNAVVDERRRVAEESIAAAEAAVAEFVTAHPDVVDEARSKVERWAAARATGSSPAPIVRTPPENDPPARVRVSPAPDAGEE